jgi:hypothetical protein
MPAPDTECTLTSCHEPGTGSICDDDGSDTGHHVCTGHTSGARRHGYTIQEVPAR